MTTLQQELARLRTCRMPYTTPHRWLQLIESLEYANEALNLYASLKVRLVEGIAKVLVAKTDATWTNIYEGETWLMYQRATDALTKIEHLICGKGEK